MAKKKNKRPFIKKPEDISNLVGLGILGLAALYIVGVMIYAAVAPGDSSWAENMRSASTWIFNR